MPPERLHARRPAAATIETVDLSLFIFALQIMVVDAAGRRRIEFCYQDADINGRFALIHRLSSCITRRIQTGAGSEAEITSMQEPHTLLSVNDYVNIERPFLKTIASVIVTEATYDPDSIMPTSLHSDEFLKLAQTLAVVDVRAPTEFAKGHIPHAINLPLFDDTQRETIGKTYGRIGQLEAILQGLEIVGPKMRRLAEQALELARPLDHDEATGPPKILLHCSRGGMRSQSMAWLFEQVNLDPLVLDGGYKAYRRHVHDSFNHPVKFIVLSGLTGAGKTRQIANLKARGEQVLDLEGLAHHRGSAFGGIGQRLQPTVEQFENDIHQVLRHFDCDRRVWVEDESRKVGSVIIPQDLFDQIKAAPAIFMDVNRKIRTTLIIQEYGQLPVHELKLAIERIAKRLGGQNVIAANQAIDNGDLPTCVSILLEYYDKTYLIAKSKLTREVSLNVRTSDPDSQETTDLLLESADTLCAEAHVG